MTWFKNSEGRYGANGAKGDLGESIVEEYCKTNSILFADKNDINSQVKLKIDCIIDGVTVDVKSNYYNGMLCVELYTRKNGAGWLYTTTAEQIYGVDVDTKSIYRYNIKDMLAYVSENKARAKKTKFGDIVMWVPVKSKLIEKLQSKSAMNPRFAFLISLVVITITITLLSTCSKPSQPTYNSSRTL